jgi:hypothetical protein
MTAKLKGWMVLLLLGGVAAYAIAEEITLTTYYPSPRGVYDELRTLGNVQIGRLETPGVGAPTPRLRVVQPAPDLDNTKPAFRVEDEAPNGDLIGDTPFLIDANGNVGIGTPSPGVKLEVQSAADANGFGGMMVSGAASGVNPGILFKNADQTYPNIAGIGVAGNDGGFGASLKGDLVLRGDIGHDVRLNTMITATDVLTRLIVKNNGNVGIGTTSPFQELTPPAGSLEVNGRIKAGNYLVVSGGDFGPWVGAPSGSTYRQWIGKCAGGTECDPGIGDSLHISGWTNPAFGMLGGNTKRVLALYNDVLVPSGNVGIGTAVPTAKLHIGGTAGVDGIRFPDGTLQTTAVPVALSISYDRQANGITDTFPLGPHLACFLTRVYTNVEAGDHKKCELILDSGNWTLISAAPDGGFAACSARCLD